MQRNRVAKVLAEFYNISGTACVGRETRALFEICTISRQCLYTHYSAEIEVQSGCGMIMYDIYYNIIVMFMVAFCRMQPSQCNHQH